MFSGSRSKVITLLSDYIARLLSLLFFNDLIKSAPISMLGKSQHDWIRVFVSRKNGALFTLCSGPVLPKYIGTVLSKQCVVTVRILEEVCFLVFIFSVFFFV